MESFCLLPFPESSGGASSIADLLLSFFYLRLSKNAFKPLLSDYEDKGSGFIPMLQVYLCIEWFT